MSVVGGVASRPELCPYCPALEGAWFERPTCVLALRTRRCNDCGSGTRGSNCRACLATAGTDKAFGCIGERPPSPLPCWAPVAGRVRRDQPWPPQPRARRRARTPSNASLPRPPGALPARRVQQARHLIDPQQLHQLRDERWPRLGVSARWFLPVLCASVNRTRTAPLASAQRHAPLPARAADLPPAPCHATWPLAVPHAQVPRLRHQQLVPHLRPRQSRQRLGVRPVQERAVPVDLRHVQAQPERCRVQRHPLAPLRR